MIHGIAGRWACFNQQLNPKFLKKAGNIMMKKTLLIGLLMFALSLPSFGWAATVGNIAETQGALGKFSLGLEYDGVFDRDGKWKSGSFFTVTVLGVSDTIPFPEPGFSIEDIEVESNRIFLKGTLGVHPNVDIFVKLGTADADWEAKYKHPEPPDSKLEFEGDSDFAWGVGAKVKIFETPGGLRLMADAQYLSYEVDGDFTIDGEELGEAGGYENLYYDSKTEITEWQVALYVNRTFGNWSPYAGVKYSDFQADWELDGSGLGRGTPYFLKLEGDLEADDNLGVFLGTDIYIIPNQLSVNIEARFLDETAGTIGVNYRF